MKLLFTKTFLRRLLISTAAGVKIFGKENEKEKGVVKKLKTSDSRKIIFIFCEKSKNFKNI